VDTSHPPVYFYGSPRDEFYNSQSDDVTNYVTNGVTQGSVNQFFDTPLYIDTQSQYRNSSSLQNGIREPKSYDPIPVTVGISVKPRQDDVTERTFVQPDHYDVINGIVFQSRKDDLANGINAEPSYYDVTEKILVQPQHVGIRDEVKSRHDDVIDGVVVPLHDVVIDGDVVPLHDGDVQPRHDRMDDFKPNGGLVTVNETLLRAVGLVQSQVMMLLMWLVLLTSWIIDLPL